MNRNENLPPGVRLDDIDPDVCPRCEGQGEIENPSPRARAGMEDEDWITCPSCCGLGVLNERTK